MTTWLGRHVSNDELAGVCWFFFYKRVSCKSANKESLGDHVIDLVIAKPGIFV